MKIKNIILIICLSGMSMLSWWESTAADCEYLNEHSGSSPITATSTEAEKETAFNNLYPYNVCAELAPINKEAEDYVQSIKDFKKKTMAEVMYDIGETLCRDHFCNNENSIYAKYKAACDTAYQKTREKTFQKALNINESGKTLSGANKIKSDCLEMVDRKLQAYKDAAIEEAGRYQKDIIEWSSDTYLSKAHEVFDKVADKFNNFLLKFGAIARSFEAFTGRAFV